MNKLPEKVKAALKNIPPFKKVVVGLSGGMDSVVLTHILKHLGYEVIVAHLNHNLRGDESEEDERFVVELAKAWKLAWLTKKAVIPTEGNLENNSRNIRYAYLEEVREAFRADFIAVGHHFDDQIETVLMHQKRGSGLRGLRGMRLIKGKIIRPMIDLSRDEIIAYQKDHLLDCRIDESNFDLSFERNHLRHKVIPQLKQDPDFEMTIRKTLQEANEKLDALQKEKDVWIGTNIHQSCFSREAFKVLNKDLKVEILLHLLGQQDVYSKTLGRLINFIETGKTGKELSSKNILFIIEYDKIRYMSEIEADLKPAVIEEQIQWGNYRIKVKKMKNLRVRHWQEGDKFQPAGMEGHKKLQDFFVDQKIPRHERKRIPVLVNERDEVICVADLRFNEKHKHLKEFINIEKNHA